MRVGVVGAGAIGGHLSARLARAGMMVSVVARGDKLTALREHGIRVQALDGAFETPVRAVGSAAEAGVQDVLLVCVKAMALPEMADVLPPMLGADTAVVFVTNGIPWWYFHGVGGAHEGRRLPAIDPDGRLWREIGPQRAIGGVIYSACTVLAPGVIDVKSPRNHLIMGTPDGRRSAAVDALVDALGQAGMGAEQTPAIRDAIWSKLLVNLSMGPLAVLAQRPQGEVLCHAACAKALGDILDEAATVARAMGARPDYDAERQLATIGKLMHKPSLLQDLEAGRKMEIDAMLTATLDMARLAGVDTPLMDLLFRLVILRAEALGLYP